MSYPNAAAAFDIDAGALRHRISPSGHAGPALYTQYAGGGDVLQAVEFGLKWLVNVRGGITSDGLYEVKPVNPTAAPVQSLALIWIDVSSGLEVPALTVLTGSSVNLLAIGW